MIDLCGSSDEEEPEPEPEPEPVVTPLCAEEPVMAASTPIDSIDAHAPTRPSVQVSVEVSEEARSAANPADPANVPSRLSCSLAPLPLTAPMVPDASMPAATPLPHPPRDHVTAPASSAVQRPSMGAAMVVWEVLLGGEFKAYERPVQAVLEAAFQQGASTATIEVQGQRYTVQLVGYQCKQVQLTDPSRTRRVRRRETVA